MLTDRGMMGVGVIDIRQIRSWVEAVGYTGVSEVEIFSAQNCWRKPGEEVLRTCNERHRSVV
jgi:sugar phosphate isomerase/epimerase